MPALHQWTSVIFMNILEDLANIATSHDDIFEEDQQIEIQSNATEEVREMQLTNSGDDFLNLDEDMFSSGEAMVIKSE